MTSSATAPQTASQHRLARIQVYNWGTFSGHHDLPVPRGGLLLTGPSGSGKSSLLDALSAVLVPAENLRFNAAAQDSSTADRSRSVLSYVRGAYRRSADEITGEVVTDYLRPRATRSGIALTFTRLRPEETITLVKLYHARQGTVSTDSVTQTQLLAIIVGGLFVAVVLSDVIQISVFKATGKRVFRMAPLHHHFELLGWKEVTIVIRFWLIAAIIAVAGAGMFYAEWVSLR